MCCPADAPTDDISGEHVDDERHINEPGPCRDIGKIRDPQPVGSWRLELAIDPIERAWSALVADGRALWLAADDALQAEVTHEPLDRAAGDRKALPTHLPPDLPHAVDLEVLIENPQDLRLQNIVPLFACRSARPRIPDGARRRTPSFPKGAVELRLGEIGRRLAQDLVGLAEFTHLALQGFQAICRLCRDAGALPGFNLCLLEPLVQRMRRAADLLGNRNHGRPS